MNKRIIKKLNKTSKDINSKINITKGEISILEKKLKKFLKGHYRQT